MKNFNQLKEDLGLSTGVGIASPDMPIGGTKRTKFAGYEVFDVDGTTFHRCRLGKLKFKHWKTFVGEDTQGLAIREYANQNPRKSIILKHNQDGSMMFVRHSHLNYLLGRDN